MEILTGEHRVLRRKSKRVNNVDDTLRATCSAMVETMISSGGVGLSGNQIGLLKRIIVVLHDNAPIVMINPEIVSSSEDLELDGEGCLSVPNTFVQINRSKVITVKYRDTKGKPHLEKYEGLTSRIIQHEIDHLNGILMTDYQEV